MLPHFVPPDAEEGGNPRGWDSFLQSKLVSVCSTCTRGMCGRGVPSPQSLRIRSEGWTGGGTACCGPPHTQSTLCSSEAKADPWLGGGLNPINLLPSSALLECQNAPIVRSTQGHFDSDNCPVENAHGYF